MPSTSPSPVVSERPRLRAQLQNPQVRRALVQGFLGSLLVLVGSFGVGWLAGASAVSRWWWVIPLRTETSGVILSTILLTAGCWVMFHAWLILGSALKEREQKWSASSLPVVNAAIVLWGIPQLFAVPIFSRDVYAYVNQGRLVLSGLDPYQDGVSQLDNWFQFGTDPMWAESETPYGPMFLWIEALVVRITGDAVDPAVFLFRIACVLGVALMMVFLPKLAIRFDVNPARAQWLALANPLLIISFISSVHNDALMMGFAVAGIWAAVSGRGALATVLVTISIGMKLITIVLLPFVGLLWAAQSHRKKQQRMAGTEEPVLARVGEAGWWLRFKYWFITAGLSMAILVVVGLINGYGLRWVAVLAGTGGSGSSFWSPLGILEGLISTVVDFTAINADWTLDFVRVLGRALAVVAILILMFVGRDEHILHRCTWAFTALVVLSPIIHAWYLLWLLPLFAMLGVPPDWRTKWVYFTVGFFLAFGAQDQLSVWPFLDLGDTVRLVSLCISVLCIVVIFLLPSSRWCFTHHWWKTPLSFRIPRTRRTIRVIGYPSLGLIIRKSFTIDGRGR